MKTSGKAQTHDVEKIIMGFRVEKPLREAFDTVCKQKDITGSQVIRNFMREFIQQNGQGKLIEQ